MDMRPEFFIATPLVLALSGCLGNVDVTEAVDQGGHYAQGYAMACDLSRWARPEVSVKTVMDYAEAREELQHPGRCNAGCEMDLSFWRKGAKAGARCPLSESSEMPE